ncbi:hypothetical protein [Candidatus Jidaibacter acanthamoebae]|uniref:hypothetical protein n=1 Tax=Candidatus Jidaibacter acanthamoebae TaxID=86105 RepID=UPI00057F2185|nr:hypothetical protein [Candidatus Jidaibacter acanthamoeba]
MIKGTCSSLAEELINEARDAAKTIDILIKIRSALEKIVEILNDRENARELKDKIQQNLKYISSIEGHINSGRSLEQAKLLYEMGIVEPITTNQAASQSKDDKKTLSSSTYGGKILQEKERRRDNSEGRSRE